MVIMVSQHGDGRRSPSMSRITRACRTFRRLVARSWPAC